MRRFVCDWPLCGWQGLAVSESIALLACAYALRTSNGTAHCGKRNEVAFFLFFLLVFVPVHLHTGGHRALLIHKVLMNKFPCGILKPVYLRVCRILIKKMTAVHSRRKCDASVSFKLAVAFERTCQLQVFCSAAILHVFLPGHVTSVFFFLFYWIFRSYTLCGFLLDWGAFWQWATQHFVPPDSQLYLGNTCIRDLLLASSRPVIRAFWNSVARAEDLLETNTSLLWETDIVIVGIFGTVSSCDHHCNCLVVELGACACEAFSLATDVLVDFFFFLWMNRLYCILF